MTSNVRLIGPGVKAFRMLAWALFVVAALGELPGLAARRQQTITEAQAREWAAYAVKKAGANQEVFDKTFSTLARIVAPAYRAFYPLATGVLLHQTEDLHIELVGPVSSFQSAVSEAVRKFEPTGNVPWRGCASVHVLPLRIEAADIEKIIVTRDGNLVEPRMNMLVPTPMTTRAGLKQIIHAGSVCFPSETFAPGSQVVVIAVPASGRNITRPLVDGELRMII